MDIYHSQLSNPSNNKLQMQFKDKMPNENYATINSAYKDHPFAEGIHQCHTDTTTYEI